MIPITTRHAAAHRATGFDQTFAEAAERARSEERAGRWLDARIRYEALLSTPLISTTQFCSTLRCIGKTYLEEGDPEAALPVFHCALAAAEQAHECAAEAHALNWIAIATQSMGDTDRSEQLYVSARVRASEAGDDLLVALVDQNLGTLANVRGTLTLALDSYRSSLQRFRALGLKHYEAVVLNNMGMVYTDLSEWTNAGDAYDQARLASIAAGDSVYQKRIEVNQIELWIARRDLTMARERCEDLVNDAAHASAPWLGEVYKHFGVICREQCELDRADECLERAANIAAATRDVLLAAETAREQAELYWLQSRNADTLQALNRAHGLFTALRAERDLATIGRRNARLERRFLDVVRRWGESIESKDCYTQGHCVRVADLACTLAGQAGFDDKTLFWFRIGALLHDVGKLSVPEQILNKPGKLDAEEWRIMQRHPEAGVELLADIEFPWDVRPMVRNHHEKWDGTGYPDRLAGLDIPVAARILCIADVYDALTTTRSYRPGFSHEHAVAIMVENNAAGHFDPSLFKLFLEWSAMQQNRAAA